MSYRIIGDSCTDLTPEMKEEGKVKIVSQLKDNPERLCIEFSDQGVPFNPLEKPDPDITLSAEERNIGGLGIFLTKKFMDKVEYRFENGSNILYIEKKL